MDAESDTLIALSSACSHINIGWRSREHGTNARTAAITSSFEAAWPAEPDNEPETEIPTEDEDVSAISGSRRRASA
jgi:hypothetical protein